MDALLLLAVGSSFLHPPPHQHTHTQKPKTGLPSKCRWEQECDEGAGVTCDRSLPQGSLAMWQVFNEPKPALPWTQGRDFGVLLWSPEWLLTGKEHHDKNTVWTKVLILDGKIQKGAYGSIPGCPRLPLIIEQESSRQAAHTGGVGVLSSSTGC